MVVKKGDDTMSTDTEILNLIIDEELDVFWHPYQPGHVTIGKWNSTEREVVGVAVKKSAFKAAVGLAAAISKEERDDG
jgi:hypothetical protein